MAVGPIKAVVEHVAVSSVGERGRAVHLRIVGGADFWQDRQGTTVWLWTEPPPSAKPLAAMNEGELRGELATATDSEYCWLTDEKKLNPDSEDLMHLRTTVSWLRWKRD